MTPNEKAKEMFCQNTYEKQVITEKIVRADKDYYYTVSGLKLSKERYRPYTEVGA